jgi:hypothetical protein
MRVFRRAAELLGSERALARHLWLTSLELAMILRGAEKPPREVFVEAVDLLLEHGYSSFSDAPLPSLPIETEAPSIGDKQQGE